MDVPPEVREAAPGILGSLTAVLFLRENWRRSCVLFLAGVACAYFVGPSVSRMIGDNAAVAGYVTGLFGMSVVAKVFEVILSLNARRGAESILKAIVRRIGG